MQWLLLESLQLQIILISKFSRVDNATYIDKLILACAKWQPNERHSIDFVVFLMHFLTNVFFLNPKFQGFWSSYFSIPIIIWNLTWFSLRSVIHLLLLFHWKFTKNWFFKILNCSASSLLIFIYSFFMWFPHLYYNQVYKTYVLLFIATITTHLVHFCGKPYQRDLEFICIPGLIGLHRVLHSCHLFWSDSLFMYVIVGDLIKGADINFWKSLSHKWSGRQFLEVVETETLLKKEGGVTLWKLIFHWNSKFIHCFNIVTWFLSLFQITIRTS